MNIKRFVAASLAVFLVSQILEFLIHGVILKATYDSLKHLWRPDMESKMWIMYLVGFITSFLFTYIFVKGYENKGILEGVRFGVIIGLFTSIPMAYGTYAMIPIPYLLASHWFIYGMAETVAMGIVVALVYKPAASA